MISLFISLILYRVYGQSEYFVLKNENSDLCIFANSDGRFGVFDCYWYDDQLWKFHNIDGTYFQLVNKQSNKCLYHLSTGNLGASECYDESGDAFYWQFLYGASQKCEWPDFGFMIKNKKTGGCIYSNEDGRFDVLWQCNPHYEDQCWYRQ